MESTYPNTYKIANILCVFLILVTLVHNQTLPTQLFCHSNCISYIGACHDTTATGCYVCADSIFRPKDFTNPSNPCVPKDQRRVVFQ